jgi:hypothetical protein
MKVLIKFKFKFKFKYIVTSILFTFNMIVNINYRGQFLDSLSNLEFGSWKPQQFVGKCRIMGCKSELKTETLPFRIGSICIQSITVVNDLKQKVNLPRLGDLLNQDCMYEPVLFSALRVLKYNPLCVNVFASGKVVILGLKTLDYKSLVDGIMTTITSHINNAELLWILECLTN